MRVLPQILDAHPADLTLVEPAYLRNTLMLNHFNGHMLHMTQISYNHGLHHPSVESRHSDR